MEAAGGLHDAAFAGDGAEVEKVMEVDPVERHDTLVGRNQRLENSEFRFQIFVIAYKKDRKTQCSPVFGAILGVWIRKIDISD
jgi:hypothetical protein